MRTVYYIIEGDYILFYNKNGQVIDDILLDERFPISFQLDFWATELDTEDTITFETLDKIPY